MQTKTLRLKRALRAALMVLLLGVVGMTAKAQDFTVGDLNYSINDDGVSVTVTGHVDGSAATGTLTIPDHVTYNETNYAVTVIGNSAFKDCTGLTGDLIIPNSVTSVMESSFNHCWSLTSIEIPNSVTSLGDYAFYKCGGLTSIEIPNSVVSIGSFAFSGCIGLTSIEIPNSVTGLGVNPFAECNLEQINVNPENLVFDSRNNCNAIIWTSMNSLIAGCKNTVVPNNVVLIHQWAFCCSGLTAIEIPNSVIHIEPGAFNSCRDLVAIELPNSVISIGQDAFANCNSLTSVIIPSSVTLIGKNSFASCSSLEQIMIDPDNAYYDSRENCNAIINTTTNEIILGCKNTIIPNSVTSIGEYAFYYCTGLASIEIPNSVTYIGGYAFSGCYSLMSINIPNSVTSIGEWAFSSCSGLTSIEIPNSVTSIGDYAFYCSSLTSIEISNSVTSIGDAAFYYCHNLNLITVLANNPPVLGTNVFFYVDKSIPVYVPTGSIAAYQAAEGWNEFTNFQEITSPIGNIVFADVNVKALCVANWDTNGDGELSYAEAAVVTDLGEVFNQNHAITKFDELQYFTGLILIHDYAFHNCNNLTKITLPNSVISIGENAFSGCSNMTSFTIPNSVVSIGREAFYYCIHLSSLSIPNSVVSIGDWAFSFCIDLISITIPSSVTSIGYGLFSCCLTLAQIVVEPDNMVYDSRESCNAIINSTTNELVAGCKNTIIPNTVTSIGKCAFYNCITQQTSLTIPNSVTSIERQAFCQCSGLVSIDIPNSLSSIGVEAFGDCTNLTSIFIPNSVASIGDAAFRGCYNVEQIVVDSGNMVYDSRENCNAIINSISNELIAGCNNTIIPNSVSSIGSRAFFWCNGLTSIEIPNSMTSIESGAFDGCTGLTSITVLANNPPILGYGAFNAVEKAIPVFVPCGSMEAYHNAAGWNEFTNYQCLDGYSIMSTTNPSNCGIVSGTGTYIQGSLCSLMALANAGYSFVNWTENGEEISSDAIYCFTVTSDRDLVANFTPHDFHNEYFTLESLADDNIVVFNIPSDITSEYLTSVSYSIDGINWTTIDIDSTDQSINVVLGEGEKLYLKGIGNQYCNSSFCNISASGSHFVYGNLMSLLYGDEFISQTEFPYRSSNTFKGLFYGNRYLVSAANLLLPATTLKYGCYSGMFDSCTSLVKAPALPATVLDSFCYYGMFYGCTLLTDAPALPATVLAFQCYWAMFENCTSLTEAPELPATTLSRECYRFMFQGCTSLTDPPSLPATTLEYMCYGSMFSGCYSLTETPALPATILADWCYSHMFFYCTSLTTAPSLPATSLKEGCYCSMFYNCTSLIEAPVLPATILARRCYEGMFAYCTSLIESPALPATTLKEGCYRDMFHYCTSLTEAPALPATILARRCYGGMFSGCMSLTEAPALPATTLEYECYSNMFSRCTSLTTPPLLPATTLVDNCYACMFYGCISLTTAPLLLAITIVDYCYDHMFYGCNNLNEVTCLATDISATNCTRNWLYGVAATGTFYKNVFMEDWILNSTSGIPQGWNIEYASIMYSITTSANPEMGGTVTGSDVYSHGATATLTATANEGYTFVNWIENGEVVSTESDYSFTVTGNRNLVANFSEVTGDYHWEVNINAYPNTMSVVGVVVIDGEEQFRTDLEVGVFCGDECRGRERLSDEWYDPATTPHYYLFLTVYGEDDDALTFRIYDHSLDQELGLRCLNTETFATNGTLGDPDEPYAIEFSNTIIQTADFGQGWNWWSSYVVADDLMAQLKAGLGNNGKQIKSQSKFTMHYSNGWMGQLNSLENDQTYMIQANNACSVELTGAPVNPADYPITLTTGWKWIGYPCTESMSVSEALAGITPSAGDQIKAQGNFATYYDNIGWMGSLRSLTPSAGYMYKLNGASQTLVFPNGGRGELAENVTAEGNHWTPELHAYPTNMTVMAVVELEGAELRSEAYELAAFANGEVRGSAKLMYVEPLDRYFAFLTIAGDEATELTFGLYDGMDEYLDSDDFIVYSTDAIVGTPDAPMVVRFRGTTGMEEWVNRIQVFPNPVERGESIRLSLPNTEKEIHVEIVNALGIVVDSRHAMSVRTITAPIVSGVYTLRITIDGEGTYCRKIVMR